MSLRGRTDTTECRKPDANPTPEKSNLRSRPAARVTVRGRRSDAPRPPVLPRAKFPNLHWQHVICCRAWNSDGRSGSWIEPDAELFFDPFIDQCIRQVGGEVSDDLRSRRTRVAEAQSHLGHASWYEEACQDLAELHIEAAEEGFEAPDPTIVEDTRSVLRLLAKEYDELPDIQPMQDEGVGIVFENRSTDSSIFFEIEKGRSGVLFARLNGVSQRNRVSDVFRILELGGRQAMDEAGIRRWPPQLAHASSTDDRSRLVLPGSS